MFYRDKSFRSEPCYWHVDCGIDESDIDASDEAMRLIKRFKLQKAIAAPPRNCDIGTAEEQEVRFKKFCNSHYNINNVDGECNTCPLNENVKTECEFTWMQMPYEKETDNEQK